MALLLQSLNCLTCTFVEPIAHINQPHAIRITAKVKAYAIIASQIHPCPVVFLQIESLASCFGQCLSGSFDTECAIRVMLWRSRPGPELINERTTFGQIGIGLSRSFCPIRLIFRGQLSLKHRHKIDAFRLLMQIFVAQVVELCDLNVKFLFHSDIVSISVQRYCKLSTNARVATIN